MRYHLSRAARPPARPPGPCLCRRWSAVPLAPGPGRPRASVWGLALVGCARPGCCLCLPVPLLPFLPCVVCLPFPPPCWCLLSPGPLLLRRLSRAAGCVWMLQWTGQLLVICGCPGLQFELLIREAKGGLDCAVRSSCRTPFASERERLTLLKERE